MDSEKKPWDRLEGEPDGAYRAFCVYRDMGAGRTYPKVSEELDKGPNYKVYLSQLSRKYNWRERVAAYDDYYLKKTELSVQESYMAMRLDARHMRYNIIEVLQHMLGQVMSKWREDLTPRDLNYLANSARVIMDQSRIEFDDLPQNRMVKTENKKLEVVYVDEQYEN